MPTSTQNQPNLPEERCFEQDRVGVIDTPAKLLKILQLIVDERCPVSLKFSQLTNSYESSIDRLNLGEYQFSLAPEDSKHCLEHLQKKQSCVLSCLIHNHLIDFELIYPEDSTSVFNFDIPLKINIEQQRQFYRAKVRRPDKYKISLTLPDNPGSIEGQLVDISPQGLAMEFASDLQQEAGTILEQCKIQADETSEIIFRAEVRNNRVAGHSKYILGCLFVEVGKQTQKKIQKLCTTIQRREIKIKLG